MLPIEAKDIEQGQRSSSPHRDKRGPGATGDRQRAPSQHSDKLEWVQREKVLGAGKSI